MADWYVGSVQYAAVTQWAAATAYSVGDIRRQLAAVTFGNERCFRCTTAGTSGGTEPSWNLNAGGTTSDGSVVWTEVTGNSTYNWSAPGACLLTFLRTTGRAAAGDTIYVASDHNALSGATWTANLGNGAHNNPLKIICVDPAGSVPPISSDLRFTAVEGTTGSFSVNIQPTAFFWYVSGIVFSSGSSITVQTNDFYGNLYAYKCQFVLTSTSSSSNISFGGNVYSGKITLDGSSLQFGHVSQKMPIGTVGLMWKNSATPVTGATIPTALIYFNSSSSPQIVCDGVDFSALGSGALFSGNASTGLYSASVINCRLNASTTKGFTTSAADGNIDYVITSSGAENYMQERYAYAGTLTTETTYVRDGGASDGTTAYSWKIVTTSNDNIASPFTTFPIAIWNDATGSSKTATVEIETSGVTLTDQDIWMEVEYLGSSSYPVSSLVTTKPDILNAGTNLPASSATWNGSLGSAVKQYLQVTFTPQMKGFLRATIYVAKPSTTVYVDPYLTLA